MKRVLVSLLVGVTLCGGLFGCGNKEVEKEVKPEIEVSQNFQDTVVGEPSREIVIDAVVATVQQINDDVNAELNESDGYFFTYTEVTYDSATDTIILSDYTSSKDGDDGRYLLALSTAGADSEAYEGIKETCDVEYESTRNLLDSRGVNDVDIVIVQYMDDYRIFETKNGKVVYTLAQ